MAHLHSVYDGDTHFKIIPVSRKIENTTGKVILMQNDHNSERFTFEIPRYIEGHDMSICNKVEIHYNNTDTKTKDVNKDVYEATDLQVSPDSEDVVICSWLISGNATKYAGSLYFVLRFACLTDSTIDYQWFTDIYKDITISKSIFNTETVAIDNSDILEQWKAEIEALFNSGGSGSGGGVAESVVNEKIATAKRELIGGADDLTDADTIHAAKNLARGLVNGLESKVVKTTELNNAINSALLQAKESGEFDGVDGKDGAAGKDGKDGVNGLSAYQIWLQQGNTGSEADFLESLQGADGAKGEKGDAYTLTEDDKAEIVAQLSQVEAPKIVSSIAEMTDTTKHYVLQSTGHIYAHRTVTTGGESVKTPNFTNLFDKSKVTLNAYLTGSDIGTEDGSFTTNIMPFDKANLAKPQVIRIANFPNALTAHKRSRIAFLPNGAYNGNTFCQFNSLLSGITVDTSNLGLQTITIADGGTINSGSALTNTINSIQISFRMGASTLTLADIPDLIITVNEEITYTETTTPIETFSEWYDTGISYTPTFKTDLIGVLGEGNVIYLSDNNLPSGTYTLRDANNDFAVIGTYTI